MFMAETLFEGNQYAIDKLDKAKGILSKAYYESSDFQKLVTVENSTDETDFQQLAFRHLIPKEWFTRKDVIIDVAFQQFGANLALSETHFLVDRIFGEAGFPKVDIGANVREDVISNFETFSNTQEIGAILAPIDYYVDMHTKWLTESQKIVMDIRTGALSFCNSTPSIFWSNKYMPFNDFALIDKRFGKWISKPNFDERLTIKISESKDEDTLDLLFFVTIKFTIVDPEKVLILRSPKPYLMV
jgi:hypothetical protein